MLDFEDDFFQSRWSKPKIREESSLGEITVTNTSNRCSTL